MKKMCCAERLVCAFVVSVVLFSCSDPVYLGMPYQNGEGGGTETPAVAEKKILYLTGIEYPAGYNWLPELGSGSVEATMFLMKNGKRIVEIKVGTKYQVSADADMHRNVGDHLYTDYSTDDETIIKRDGMEMFRYPDREMILSMLVEGNDVYTLGRPRSGSGFTYRCNGRILLTKGSANIVSGLYKDGENIVFAYEDVIKSTSDTRYKYYYVSDGQISSLPVANDVVRVEDIRIIDGTVHYIAMFSNKSYRVYYAGSRAFELTRQGYSSLSDFTLLYGGDKVFVKGVASKGSLYETVFWHGTDVVSYSQNISVLDWCADKENVCHLTSGNASSRTQLVLKRNMSTVVLPAQYRLIYPKCLAVNEGECCVAATNPGRGNTPVVWVDETVKEYDFNGLFTSASYQ